MKGTLKSRTSLVTMKSMKKCEASIVRVHGAVMVSFKRFMVRTSY